MTGDQRGARLRRRPRTGREGGAGGERGGSLRGEGKQGSAVALPGSRAGPGASRVPTASRNVRPLGSRPPRALRESRVYGKLVSGHTPADSDRRPPAPSGWLVQSRASAPALTRSRAAVLSPLVPRGPQSPSPGPPALLQTEYCRSCRAEVPAPPPGHLAFRTPNHSPTPSPQSLGEGRAAWCNAWKLREKVQLFT